MTLECADLSALFCIGTFLGRVFDPKAVTSYRIPKLACFATSMTLECADLSALFCGGEAAECRRYLSLSFSAVVIPTASGMMQGLSAIPSAHTLPRRGTAFTARGLIGNQQLEIGNDLAHTRGTA